MSPKEVLKQITSRLELKKIKFVVGGSGLLYFLGLQSEIGDWDIMTDAPLVAVKECLQDIDYIKIGPKAPFVSDFLLQIELDGFKVDVIGGFALENSDGRFEVPAEEETIIEDFPIARVDLWIKVYEILGQHQKATLLREWQLQNSI